MKKRTQKQVEAELVRKIDEYIREKESREWKCKGFLGYKMILIAGLLALTSCTSTYRLNGQSVKVRDGGSPRKYGFVLAFSIGLGEQFKKPSR